MPITPLHFGVMAPINHFFPGKVSFVSFVLVNLWMDGSAIRNWFFNLPLPEHSPYSHSYVAAAVMGAIVAVFGFRSRKWIYGAFVGAFSHVLLDSLVHAEMQPFFPKEGNPFYQGWLEPLSWALMPLTGWLTVQIVSGSLGWVRTRLAAARARSATTGA